ncbi:predicted protein [Arabidopsis lyrata subsp. lyrata]|uniref:Predicted protein n=1 Tax=Arabidopsis lyrata subsp. lyrata TaxID=81972 RepID=D7MP78_ARALL|nr:predicted protein [Arabidopsis lyrata subsp. lyrata]
MPGGSGLCTSKVCSADSYLVLCIFKCFTLWNFLCSPSEEARLTRTQKEEYPPDPFYKQSWNYMNHVFSVATFTYESLTELSTTISSGATPIMICASRVLNIACVRSSQAVSKSTNGFSIIATQFNTRGS